MNIRKYEAFVKAVELGSLSKAAEELGYTQSGISHMMQSLEDEVGFPLMVRTSTGIQPNREGELLLPVIRQMLCISEISGSVTPFSHRETLRLVVPSFSANCSWVSPCSFLRVAIKDPIL